MGEVLEVARFEDLLADDWKDLREEVLDMLLSDDLGDGPQVQLIKYLNEFVENREGLVLGRNGIHVGGSHLLPPLLLRDVLKRIS